MGFGMKLPGPFSVHTSGRAGKYAKKMHQHQTGQDLAGMLARMTDNQLRKALEAMDESERDATVAKLVQYAQVSPSLAEKEKQRIIRDYRKQQSTELREAWQSNSIALSTSCLEAYRDQRDKAQAKADAASSSFWRWNYQKQADNLAKRIAKLEARLGVDERLDTPDNPAAVSDRR